MMMLIMSAYELCILTLNFIKTYSALGLRLVFPNISSIELSLLASSNTYYIMTLN